MQSCLGSPGDSDPSDKIPAVRLLGRVLLVWLLVLSASGATTLIVTESCQEIIADDSASDDACPPTCPTCRCCAQSVELMTIALVPAPETPVRDIPATLPALPPANPREILHVPKSRLS